MTDFYWYWLVVCGFVANLWLMWRVGRLLGAAIVAAVAATSITRFAWCCARVHGFRVLRFPAWMYVPRLWLVSFLCNLDGKSRTISHFGGYGTWNGIGDWTVHLKVEAA